MNAFRAAITIVLLAAFASFILYLIHKSNVAELRWDRLTYLFNGVEAIVFAAVGWLFGREVHRAQAASAEQRAGQERQRADQAQGQASQLSQDVIGERERGRALVQAVLTADQQPIRERRLQAMGPGATAAAAQADVGYLAELAKNLYPEHTQQP